MRRSVVGLVSLALGVALAGPVANPAHAAPGAPSPSQPRLTRLGLAHPVGPARAPSVREVIVRTRPGAVAARLGAAASGFGARPLTRLDRLRSQSFLVPAADVASVVASLRARSDVASVTVPEPPQFFDVPDDTLYATSQATYFDQIGAPAAWTRTHGSAAVRIAVVDSGVDVAHADLAGKIVGTYNAVTGTSDVTDEIGHGTFVAGVAAAATSNATGIAGAGWDTSILAVKVADAQGDLFNSAITAGILWAADHGANVINVSLGSSTSDPSMADAIAQVRARGIVVVAAAGNSGGMGNPKEYPAAYPGVIAVGATDPGTQTRAAFSQYGSWVSVAAPGVGIAGTCSAQVNDAIPSRINNASQCPADSYLSGSGTSFAAPIVAAEAALLLASHPGSTEAELRTAITTSAHGYAGLGLGSGLVDFGAAFDHIAPATVPTLTVPGDGQTVSGDLTLTASSTAPAVRFAVDGVAVGGPVPVSAGQATAPWSTYGFSGVHVVSAADCSTAGVCRATPGSASVTVANAAPVITSPSSGSALSGGFTVTATAPGGGVQVLVDGRVVGFDASAPYAVAVVTSLSDAAHQVTARTCDVAGSRCAGATSVPVSITSTSLHPSVTSISPVVFSPNRDGRRDSAVATVRLPDAERVTWSVVRRDGTVAVGPKYAGSWGAGAHAIVLTGLDRRGVRLPDATYTLVVSTTRASGGAVLRGSAARAFRIDSTAPTLTGITGTGTRFYPYRDGYRDAFAPTAVLSEAATVSLVVRTTRGALVRTVSVVRPAAGRMAVAWNGRTTAGRLVGAGTYTWRLVAQDRAGNVRISALGTVRVSLAHLVTRTVTVTASGRSAYDYGGTDGVCSTASTAGSAYAPNGILLSNTCDFAAPADAQDAFAFWHLPVPAAIRYTAITLSVFGAARPSPATVVGGLTRVTDGTVQSTGAVNLFSRAAAWYPLGRVSGAARVSARTITARVSVPNSSGVGVPPRGFDIRYVRAVVAYQVLA